MSQYPGYGPGPGGPPGGGYGGGGGGGPGYGPGPGGPPQSGFGGGPGYGPGPGGPPQSNCGGGPPQTYGAPPSSCGGKGGPDYGAPIGKGGWQQGGPPAPDWLTANLPPGAQVTVEHWQTGGGDYGGGKGGDYGKGPSDWGGKGGDYGKGPSDWGGKGGDYGKGGGGPPVQMMQNRYGAGPPPQDGGGMDGGKGGAAWAPQGGGDYETYNVFVEVTPEIQPNFGKGPPGCFVLEVPSMLVGLKTTCNPPLPNFPGLVPFKPFEQFEVHLPQMRQVMIDARTGQPRDGSPAWCQVHKRGGIVEIPTTTAYKAQLKTESPYGSLILEDVQVSGDGYKQKIGETVLNYKCQVEGKISVNSGGGHSGSNLLEVDLDFNFQFSMGGSPAVESQGQGGYSSAPPQSGYGGAPPSGYGGPPPYGGGGDNQAPPYQGGYDGGYDGGGKGGGYGGGYDGGGKGGGYGGKY